MAWARGSGGRRESRAEEVAAVYWPAAEEEDGGEGLGLGLGVGFGMGLGGREGDVAVMPSLAGDGGIGLAWLCIILPPHTFLIGEERGTTV